MFEMKKKIEELQAKLNASDECEFRDDVYWRRTPIEIKANDLFAQIAMKALRINYLQ